MRTVLRLLAAAVVTAAALFALPAGASAASSPTPTATTVDGDVYATVSGPDGTTSVTVYRPAPGVAPDELRAHLAVAGVAGLQAPSRPPQAALACSYGSAVSSGLRPWASSSDSAPMS